MAANVTPSRDIEDGSGTELFCGVNVRSSKTYCPGDPVKVIDLILADAIDKNVETPLVPSLFGDPTLEPRIELLPSNAVSVRKSRLVYQRPTMLCGDRSPCRPVWLDHP